MRTKQKRLLVVSLAALLMMTAIAAAPALAQGCGSGYGYYGVYSYPAYSYGWDDAWYGGSSPYYRGYGWGTYYRGYHGYRGYRRAYRPYYGGFGYWGGLGGGCY